MIPVDEMRRDISEVVAACFPGSMVCVRASQPKGTRTFIQFVHVCPDCQAKLPIRFSVETNQLAVFASHPKELVHVIESLVIQSHP